MQIPPEIHEPFHAEQALESAELEAFMPLCSVLLYAHEHGWKVSITDSELVLEHKEANRRIAIARADCEMNPVAARQVIRVRLADRPQGERASAVGRFGANIPDRPRVAFLRNSYTRKTFASNAPWHEFDSGGTHICFKSG